MYSKRGQDKIITFFNVWKWSLHAVSEEVLSVSLFLFSEKFLVFVVIFWICYVFCWLLFLLCLLVIDFLQQITEFHFELTVFFFFMRNGPFLRSFFLFIDRRSDTNKIFLPHFELTLELLVLFLLVSDFEPTNIVFARGHRNMESVWREFTETCLSGCLDISFLWLLKDFLDPVSDVHIGDYQLLCWLFYLFFVGIFVLKQGFEQIVGDLIQTILMIVILERHQLFWSL